MLKEGLGWVTAVLALAVAACSSSERSGPDGSSGAGGSGGADNVAGAADSGGAAKGGGNPSKGGKSSGGSPTTGGVTSNGGAISSAGRGTELTGPSCPDGVRAVILENAFPQPTAECAAFVEDVCPGKLDECAQRWCGAYFACACQCAEDDLSCYAGCGFPSDCDRCISTVQDCGIGFDIKLELHPGTPCYPPLP